MADRFVMYSGQKEYAAVVEALVKMGFTSSFSVEESLNPVYEEGYIRINEKGRMSYGSQGFFKESYFNVLEENIYQVEMKFSAILTLPKPKTVMVDGVLFTERDVIAALKANGVLPYDEPKDYADGLPC